MGWTTSASTQFFSLFFSHTQLECWSQAQWSQCAVQCRNGAELTSWNKVSSVAVFTLLCLPHLPSPPFPSGGSDLQVHPFQITPPQTQPPWRASLLTPQLLRAEGAQTRSLLPVLSHSFSHSSLFCSTISLTTPSLVSIFVFFFSLSLSLSNSHPLSISFSCFQTL